MDSLGGMRYRAPYGAYNILTGDELVLLVVPENGSAIEVFNHILYDTSLAFTFISLCCVKMVMLVVSGFIHSGSTSFAHPTQLSESNIIFDICVLIEQTITIVISNNPMKQEQMHYNPGKLSDKCR